MGDDCHCWVQIGPYTLHACISTGAGQPGVILAPGDQVWMTAEPQDWIIMEPGATPGAEPPI